MDAAKTDRLSLFERALESPDAERRRGRGPVCSSCRDSLAVAGHRCPRQHACVDCLRPADVFVPDDFGAAAAANILASGGSALCDRCLTRRLRRAAPAVIVSDSGLQLEQGLLSDEQQGDPSPKPRA